MNLNMQCIEDEYYDNLSLAIQCSFINNMSEIKINRKDF